MHATADEPVIVSVEPHYNTGIVLRLSDGTVVELVPVNAERPGDPGVRNKVLTALRRSLKA
jgi:hypothetical protein